MTVLVYTDPEAALDGVGTLVAAGSAERLQAPDVVARLPAAVRSRWSAMVNQADAGDEGATAETWLDGEAPARVVACVLPATTSRHNSPARPHVLAKLLARALGGPGDAGVLLALDEAAHGFAAGCAVPRVLPLYDRKVRAGGEPPERAVRVCLVAPDAPAPDLLDQLAATAEGIRTAARLVDMPASELHTDAFVEELGALADAVGATMEVLRGTDLEARGYGGLWNVGRTATHPPALVVLTHAPEGARRSVVWVGKGIVYDTGGLSLKGKTGMPGMKGDMGGAAAVAGAFAATVRAGFEQRLQAVLCLAENSIGPGAMRPDDVITQASGKTVEVNNTDAEGRLVLGDGVAHAVAHLTPDVIVDLATLTGAQPIATGRRHAGVVTNDERLERLAVAAGRASGDLVHPLPYCPEFHRLEFKSKVADLKNSVKDRSNAQSSCAAQFVAEHLGAYAGPWMHVDMAGPSTDDERGTGYGVALLTQLFLRGEAL